MGIGNPGWAYKGTRHNVGFMALDELAKLLGCKIRSRRFHSLVAEVEADGARVVLAKPQTFVNLSGRAAQALASHYGVQPSKILVICDDVNLPLGRIRVRASGSDGGHNGLKSIIGCLGTQAFPRIRIGIGQPPDGNMVDYVLSRFHRSELPTVREQVCRAAEAAMVVIREGVEAAMNRFNARA